MIGTYKFYEKGRLIAAEKNLITNEGKNAILAFMAGYTGNFAADICFGAGETAAAAANTDLELQWARTPIVSISPDYINTMIVYKARLDAGIAGKIYEAGLRSQQSNQSDYNSRTLIDFSSTAAWSIATFNATNSRVGPDSLRLSPAASATSTATLADTFMDLSGYSVNDSFRLGYQPNDAFTASIFVRLYTDASNYFTFTVSAPTSGYKIATFTKSNAVATGSPDWGNITSVAASVTSTAGGAAQVDFDTFQVVDLDDNSEHDALISRAVLGTPVTKTAGLPLDIEYTLDVTL